MASSSGHGDRVSLRDVAALAGVSVKTVSNVVNGYVHVTEATRTRVQAAIAELNYRPNLAARQLRQGRSDVIALALPELDLPYFAELARSVIKSAEERGWTVLIDQTDGRVEREQLVLDGIRGRLIDGLIFSPIALGAEELGRRRDTVPLVLLGERVYDGPADHVSIDNVAAAREATAHLVGLGRRRIAAIGDQPRPQSQTAHLRRRGYQEALAEAGLPVSEDVAVVGWDDVEDSRYSVPSLTTISPDKQQIATLAVEFLAARLGGGRTEPPREVSADFTLAVRESTAGADAVRSV